MSHLMTCGDAPNCTWTDLAIPTFAGVQLCQTPGGIYLIVTMEDTMKKTRVWDAGRAFALAEDIVL